MEAQARFEFWTKLAAALGGVLMQRTCDAHAHPEHDNYQWIDLGNDRSIALNNHNYPASADMTMKVYGKYPQSKDETHDSHVRMALGYRGIAPIINVSMTRSVESAAKDIQKRFMPEYEELFVKVLEFKKNHDEYLAGRNNNTNAIKAAINPEKFRVYPYKENNGMSFSPWDSDKSVHGDVETFKDSVTLKLSGLTREQAEEIIKKLTA